MVCDMVKNKNKSENESPAARNAGTEPPRTYLPACDVIEKESELLLLADMPGVRAEDIEISFERGLLTIHATGTPKREAGRKYLHREYGVGDYHRSFQIGDEIDAGRIEADFKSGVLTLRLPKSVDVLPRKIAVKAE